MREILFRGMRTDNGEWVTGYYFCMSHNDKRHHSHHFIIPLGCDLFKERTIAEIQVEVDSKTVCQYTGLKDMNGTRIFEGDLVYIPKDEEYAGIKWDDEDAKFYISRDNIYADFDNYYGSELEVIGNIFDNSDLLGGGAE